MYKRHTKIALRLNPIKTSHKRRFGYAKGRTSVDLSCYLLSLTCETMPKVALISGVTGQDIAYLGDLLLEKGHVVHGIKRRYSSFNTRRIDHLYKDEHEKATNFYAHFGGSTNTSGKTRIVNTSSRR